MRKYVAAFLIGLFCLAGFGQTDPWQPVRFLIGSWDAKTTEGGQSTGSYSFQPDLKNHVIVRQSSTADCKTGSGASCEHGDILYIYTDDPGAPLRAIYFDNEGHTIHYNVTASSPTSAVFLSDPAQPGPQYRLTYELASGIMRGKFQIKIPGQSEFRSYLEWSGGRINR